MVFIGKRLLITLVTLLMVSLFTFAAFTIIPGDPATLALGIEASDEQIAELRAKMGLDRSFLEQYVRYLYNFLTGNLGNSSRFQGMPISRMILERLPVTFSLAGFSLLLILAIAFPLILLSVKREGSFLDLLLNTITTMNISLPSFFLGVLYIWLFGIILRLFTPSAYISYRDSFPRFLAYLFFPALAIATPNAAILIKFMRTAIFKEYHNDYVRTAHSKGNSHRQTLLHHVFKNALIPGITMLGMIIADIFSGSIVIEQVFTIPGIGRLLITAISSRDYPLVETLVLYIAFVVILANTLVDIVIQVIDPRIRVQ